MLHLWQMHSSYSCTSLAPATLHSSYDSLQFLFSFTFFLHPFPFISFFLSLFLFFFFFSALLASVGAVYSGAERWDHSCTRSLSTRRPLQLPHPPHCVLPLFFLMLLLFFLSFVGFLCFRVSLYLQIKWVCKDILTSSRLARMAVEPLTTNEFSDRILQYPTCEESEDRIWVSFFLFFSLPDFLISFILFFIHYCVINSLLVLFLVFHFAISPSPYFRSGSLSCRRWSQNISKSIQVQRKRSNFCEWYFVFLIIICIILLLLFCSFLFKIFPIVFVMWLRISSEESTW